MAVHELMRLAIENDDFELVYVLLMSEPIPRCITYDLALPRFDIDTLTDDQCWVNLRFVKNDVLRLAALLDLPAVIHVSNGCVCTRVDALCMVLRRFSYPNRLCDLESFFGRPTSDHQRNCSCDMGQTSPSPDKFRRALATPEASATIHRRRP